MGLVEAIFGPSGPDELEREFEEFRQRRQWEREVFHTALRGWVLQSGLGPLMIRQMEDYAEEAGLEDWPPEQMDFYDRDTFDPRRYDHREILEYVNERD